MAVRIRITKQVPFHGDGDSLEQRLRTVHLRGFPGVHIYKDARFDLVPVAAADIPTHLHTPQPHLHAPYLKRLQELAEAFAAEDIDIFHLASAYDYTAQEDDNTTTEWTMLPPIVERVAIPKHPKGGFDYAPLASKELLYALSENGWQINPAARTAAYPSTDGTFRIINDGVHRVHAGLLNGTGINVLEISDMTPGYPYYATPQSYDQVQIFDNPDTSLDLKVYVVTAPGQKYLYRDFPSGGIMSGTVRPARAGEHFV